MSFLTDKVRTMDKQTTLNSRDMLIDGIKFHSIMDNLTDKETQTQSMLWGVLNTDYAIELKGNGLKRFYISEDLFF